MGEWEQHGVPIMLKYVFGPQTLGINNVDFKPRLPKFKMSDFTKFLSVFNKNIFYQLLILETPTVEELLAMVVSMVAPSATGGGVGSSKSSGSTA